MRRHPDGKAWVYLCMKDGAAHAGLLYGVMCQDTADRLAEWFANSGMPVENETSPFTEESSTKHIPKVSGFF